MNTHVAAAALPLLMVLAGCASAPAEYTKAEAPAALTLNSLQSDIPLRFAPGSAALTAGEAVWLQRMARSGKITPADRVVVEAAGSPSLAAARVAAVQHVLIAYNIVPVQGAMAKVPPDHAVLHVGRTLVTLPPCPNWSKPSAADFTNTLGSDFGCATATNLGLMAASPGDLVAGRRLGPANGAVTAAAIERYEADRVITPRQFDGASASPGSSAASNAAASSGGNTGGGGGATQ